MLLFIHIKLTDLLYFLTFLFSNLTMNASNFDSHSKPSAFEKHKDLLYENYTKLIENNKNMVDSGSNNVGLSQFVEHLYNYISSMKDFFKSFSFIEHLHTFRKS